MVMSMDDQTMSSPVDESVLSQAFKQQDSVDEEQNEDEQSKGSNQTIVTQLAGQQQQRRQTMSISPITTGQRTSESDYDAQPAGESSAAMQLSRESSVDEGGRKSMQIDEDDKPREQQTDPILTKMKEIVEGPKRTGEQQQQHQQTTRSSDDSLQNNQNEETTSKASAESGAQQKRARRLHCARHHHGYHHHHAHHHHHSHPHHHHHHHHHHHRQSVSEGRVDVEQSTNNSSLQSAAQQHSNGNHHHHHHHHHRHAGQRSRHHHHHHGHHHHHHQHQQQRSKDGKQSEVPQTADSSELAGALPSDNKTDKQVKQHESKSSSSTVCSSSAQQQQQQQDKPAFDYGQTNPSQADNNKSSEATDDARERRLPTGVDETGQAGQTVHEPHHHHHHHYQHNHRCHHRHKKRLALDTSSNEQRSQPELHQEALSSVDSQQQPTCKPHHHHHHHRHGHHMHRHHHHGHHHHHHHHRHHNHNHAGRQRYRLKQTADSSKTNLDEQSKENMKDSVESGVDKSSLNQTINKSDSDTGNGLRAGRLGDKSAFFRENRMSLDHDENNNSGQTAEIKAADGELKAKQQGEDGVVKMEMSLHSDDRQGQLVGGHDHPADPEGADTKRIAPIGLMQLHGAPEAQIGRTETTSKLLSERNQETGVDEFGDKAPRQPMQGVQQHQQVFAQSTSGGGAGAHSGAQMTRRKSSSHNFSDSARETQKENHDVRENNSVEKHDKLIRQTSSNGSRRSEKTGGEQARDSAAGNNEQSANRQQMNEYPSVGSATTFHQSGQSDRQVVESNVPANRRCRLCWCCCCPCSSISNRPTVARPAEAAKAMSEPSNSPSSKCPSLPSVSLDEIRAWGESFDRLMKCTAGRKVFQDFLRCEYSEENILFWSACEELKAERDSKSIAAKARDIYEDYISILSSKEVSLDSRVREVINNNIKKPTSNIFDEAQLQIYTLMHRDSYPRFINSSMYKKLAQLQPSSRKSSS